MASTDHSDDHEKQSKPIMIQRRPMMLKDYLRDDLLSSCSSNGFKSFPRRQCCTTIRFLLEVDLKASRKQRLLRRSRSKAAASTTISALQRASEAVISAVKKQLPFHSSKYHSPSQRNGDKKGVLVPRSLSRKLFFGRSFRRKTDKRDNDLRRWRLFRDILNEQDKQSTDHHSATSVVGGWVSMGTGSSSNTDSWAESEFTSEIFGSGSGKSESSSENHAVGCKSGPPEREISRSIGETVGEDSISEATTATISGTNTKEWSNEKEKEQFSPVSVLDCPFHEDDEDTSSLSSHDKLGRIEDSGMASSQSSSVCNDFVMESPSCWCGLKTRLKTSHTKSNPGRSFFACPKYDMGDARCGFFIWTDIFNLLDQNLRGRENKVWKMWDDVLLREIEVRKREDQIRERERMLQKNHRKLLWLYWVVVIVIVLAWFG